MAPWFTQPPKNVLEQPEIEAAIKSAFPSFLASEVGSVLYHVPPSKHDPSVDGTRTVRICGEVINTLRRIYSPEVELGEEVTLSPVHLDILACLYARHNDGYVREKHVDRLCASKQEWVIPFIIQLLGEYVIEIGCRINKNIANIDRQLYKLFAAANPEYIRLCQAQILTYWSYYYPQVRFVDYPGFRVLNYLGLWTGKEGRHLINQSV
jgi:hypothetical protein